MILNIEKTVSNYNRDNNSLFFLNAIQLPYSTLNYVVNSKFLKFSQINFYVKSDNDEAS